MAKRVLSFLLAALPTALVAQQPAPAPTAAPAAAPASASAPAPAAAPAAAAPAPTPTPTLVDNIIRLWKANLSEDFLKKYVSSADVARDLSAEDIVNLRNAGLPESLILAVTQRKQELATGAAPAAAAAAPAAAAQAARAAAAPAAALATPTPAPTPATAGRWEGLARRNSGVVLFKGRWDPGILEFKDETLRWTDAKDTTKNVLVPAKAIAEQQLTCLKKPGGNECFEWVVKTKNDEYRFRDVAWEQNENAKVEELYRFLKGLYPNLVASQVPVDAK